MTNIVDQNVPVDAFGNFSKNYTVTNEGDYTVTVDAEDPDTGDQGTGSRDFTASDP